MALTFEFSFKSITTNLGDSFNDDISRAQAEPIKSLVSVQADGDELEHVQTRFANLPYAHRICTWRGEMARFILDNL